jgi:hypothetical protein
MWPWCSSRLSNAAVSVASSASAPAQSENYRFEVMMIEPRLWRLAITSEQQVGLCPTEWQITEFVDHN